MLKKKKFYRRQTPKKFTVSELFTEESGWRSYFLTLHAVVRQREREREREVSRQGGALWDYESQSVELSSLGFRPQNWTAAHTSLPADGDVGVNLGPECELTKYIQKLDVGD